MFIPFPPSNIRIPKLTQVRLPQMVRISQRYDSSKIGDPPAFLHALLCESWDSTYFCGKRIAITAGSRGIPGYPQLLRVLCSLLQDWGAQPFIVPAMGSHGGATAEGQAALLAGYGVDESSIGAPVRSCMDTVQYGVLEGAALYCDQLAFESDGIILFHKIKPHTDFRGDVESGLCKMIAIGLGKHDGAASFHRLGFSRFAELLPRAAELFLQAAPPVWGIGLVQNAYDAVCAIETAVGDGILSLDRRLLSLAKQRMARFHFSELDLLVIDEIGKNISGYGFDPNVVGRTNARQPGFSEILHLQKLFIRGLTSETHHNGCGIAAADLTTRRCLCEIDWDLLWTNILTSSELGGGRIPLYFNNDLDALRAALLTCTALPSSGPRIARIQNTLSLSQIEISLPLYQQLAQHPNVELLEGPYNWQFDAEGNLADPVL